MPGPTIEAERGWPVRVEWRNGLDGALPVLVTVAPAETDGDGVPVQCVPGLSGGMADPHAAALTGFTVVHLHGGVTPAAYDGWTENISAPGQPAVSDYPMDQRGALLWYHDHVMGVTRFTVYAGLAGLWIVRDGRERELELPEGPPFEVPLLLQQPVQDLGAEHGIVTQAWSPIGGITFYRDGNHGSTLDDPTIGDIASAHGKTAAQVMLRWGLQHGRSVIPKSTKPSRIAENIDVFEFELSGDEMTAIDGLDTGRRGGPEPDAITLEAFGREIPEA